MKTRSSLFRNLRPGFTLATLIALLVAQAAQALAPLLRPKAPRMAP